MEKKLFIKQANVYGAYVAYTDDQIGRVIQAVDDLGELEEHAHHLHQRRQRRERGGHGQRHARTSSPPSTASPCRSRTSSSGTNSGDRTGRFPHFAAGWAWAMDTPFQWVKQVASHFGGTAQGVAMSWPGHINDVGGVRRQFHHVIDIVPTILEATGVRAPETIDGIKQRPIEGVSMAYTWDKANASAPTRRHHAILRDARQSRHLSPGMGGGHDAGDHPVGALHRQAAGRDQRVQVGALQRPGRSHRVRRSGRADAGEAQAAAGRLSRRGEEVRRAAARQLDADALEHAAPEPDGRTDGVHVRGRVDRRTGQRRPEHHRKVLQHHRGGRDPEGRRGGHDRHRGRALRRLRSVPEPREAGISPQQGGVPLQPARSQAHDLGRAGARRAGNTPSCSTSSTTAPASEKAARAC